MSVLKPLIRRLQRFLRAALIRRLITWAACAIILACLGGVLSLSPWGNPMVRLSLVLMALSALPAFLFWPIPERALTEKLRRVDEETVFEAYLEAGPGPVRDLLRRLAGERAAALAFTDPVREPLLTGLGGLCLTALACAALLEAGSYFATGRMIFLSSEPATLASGGARIEEAGFSDFASEDPAARMTRRERAMERESKEGPPGENPSLGTASETAQRFASTRRNPGAEGSGSDSPDLKETLAMRKQGDRPGDETGGSPGGSSAPKASSGEGSRKGADQTSASGANPVGSGEKAKPASGDAPPGHMGQGYEHTGNTGIASPLADYRSRFDARFAERTGRSLAASGRMSFGELRDYQKRYFDSFTLQAGVGVPDDPYVAMLKRKWADAKGGAW